MLINDRYGDTCRSLLPSFQHVLKTYETVRTKVHISPSIDHQVVASLLSASRFLDRNWKLYSIQLATSILERLDKSDPESLYLQRWATQRVMFLSVESHDYSNRRVYTEFTLTDQRSNAQLGEVVMFVVRKLIERDDLSNALLELNKWGSFTAEVSTQEKPLLEKKAIYVARISHLQGDFLTAKKQLSNLHVERQETSLSCWLSSLLADVYCELGDVAKAETIT